MVKKLEAKVDETSAASPEIDLSKWEKVEPSGNRKREANNKYYVIRDFSVGKRFWIREELNSKRVRFYIGKLVNVEGLGTITRAMFELDAEFRQAGAMGMRDPYHCANVGKIQEAYRARG